MRTTPDFSSKISLPTMALAVSGIALSSGAAWAQDDASARAPRTALDEIVVQTEKTTATTQTVPVAVTAVTGKALERRFAQDLRDLTDSAPNVLLEVVGAFQNASSIFIRGAGSSDIESAADPGIAVIIDGVYQARTSTGLQDFLDVEAVEVLRGPQGTLFGRNAIGGAVLLRHRAPDLQDFTVGGSVTVGNYGRLDVKGTVNVPIVEDKLAARVAFKSTNFDGFYTNEFDDSDLGGQDRITILPSLRFANENLDVIIRGEYHRNRDDSVPNVPHNACPNDPNTTPPFFVNAAGQTNDVVINFANQLGGGAAAAALCAKDINKQNDFTVNHDHFNGRGQIFDVYGLTGEIKYNLPDLGEIVYIGNYRDVFEDVWNDFDTTPFDLFQTRRLQRHWQTSHELRFHSDFSDFVDFVVGAYYFEQHYVLEQNLFGVLGGNALNSGTSNTFGRSEQSHDQWAIFAQANWHLTDIFTLVTGVRYTEEGKDFIHCGVGFGDAANRTCFFDNKFLSFDSATDIGDGLKSNGVMQNPGTNDWSNVSPKIGLNAQITDDMFAYGSWTRGFRSGGFNGRGNTPQTAGPFDEEKANSYEIGIKWEGLDNRLRVNLVGFWTTFSNLQRTIIRPAAGGSGGQETVTENAASARSRGIEIEVSSVPAEGLTLAGSLGYLDAETRDWCADLNGPIQPTPAGITECGTVVPLLVGELRPFDNGGLPILRAPKWTANINIAYEFAVGNSGFVTVSGEWTHRSSMSLISAGFPPGTVDGVTNFDGVFVTPTRPSSDVFNGNVTWEEIDGRYRISFFVKNITNEIIINSGTYVAGLFNFRQPQHPRHWGVEIAFEL